MKGAIYMRSPKMNEIFVMLFSLYMWFTLTVDPDLFHTTDGKRGDVYKTYLDMVGSQRILAYMSLGVAITYLISLFVRKLVIIHLIHIIGLLFYFFITASYLLNYPNIAFGVMSMVSVWLFVDLLKLTDLIEEEKKQRILEANNLTDDEINS